MDNSVRIDTIIEDLKSKTGSRYSEPVNSGTLSVEQLSIKRFLEERGIYYLIHFTDATNVPSIRINGILSVEQLKKRKISYRNNDEYRQDNEPDYISLSISGMNHYLYRTFKYNKQTIEHGVAVVINADILYKEIDTPRIYCNTNAATAGGNKGNTLADFRAMFADTVEYTTTSVGERKINRSAERRTSYEPTDTQAEILWNKCVPLEYIYCYWDLEEDFFYGN